MSSNAQPPSFDFLPGAAAGCSSCVSTGKSGTPLGEGSTPASKDGSPPSVLLAKSDGRCEVPGGTKTGSTLTCGRWTRRFSRVLRPLGVPQLRPGIWVPGLFLIRSNDHAGAIPRPAGVVGALIRVNFSGSGVQLRELLRCQKSSPARTASGKLSRSIQGRRPRLSPARSCALIRSLAAGWRGTIDARSQTLARASAYQRRAPRTS